LNKWIQVLRRRERINTSLDEFGSTGHKHFLALSKVKSEVVIKLKSKLEHGTRSVWWQQKEMWEVKTRESRDNMP